LVPLAHLHISAASGNVTLTWPSDYNNWRLEASNQPEAPDSWVELLNPRTIDGSSVIVNDTAGEPGRFYRLRQP